MRLKIGGVYALRDKGKITVHSKHQTDTFDVMRCTSETGETLMYSESGKLMPADGRGGEHDAVAIISEPK